MNTIHRPPLDSAQRIYERRLALRQAALLAKAYKMRDDQHDLERVAHWMTDETPWDLPQECPKDELNTPPRPNFLKRLVMRFNARIGR